MRHVEKVGRVTESRMIPGPKYVTFEIDYVTAGGVKKTLKLAHSEADAIRAAIMGELESMPAAVRTGSFFNSLRRKR